MSAGQGAPQSKEGMAEATCGVNQEWNFTGGQNGTAAGKAKVKTDRKRARIAGRRRIAMLLVQREGMLGGGHVDQQAGAGELPLLKGFHDGKVCFFAKAKVISIENYA